MQQPIFTILLDYSSINFKGIVDMFLPIDCCVRINGKLTVYSVVIFSHGYLDSDHINFKTFVFLDVYWSISASLYNTDIIDFSSTIFLTEPPQC